MRRNSPTLIPAADARIIGDAEDSPNETESEFAPMPPLIETKPKYICPRCKEEFAKAAKVPPSGFKGRFGPKCPKGHLLVRVMGFYGSFFLYFLAMLFTLNMGRLLFVDNLGDTRSVLTIGIEVFAGLIVLLSMVGINHLIAGIRARSKEPPMNRLSQGSIGTGLGILFAIAIVLANSWYVRIRPVDLSQFEPRLGVYSVEGTVTGVSRLENESAYVYDFEETRRLVGYTVENPPKVGEHVWVLGRGYINPDGGITFLEILRRNAAK